MLKLKLGNFMLSLRKPTANKKTIICGACAVRFFKPMKLIFRGVAVAFAVLVSKTPNIIYPMDCDSRSFGSIPCCKTSNNSSHFPLRALSNMTILGSVNSADSLLEHSGVPLSELMEAAVPINPYLSLRLRCLYGCCYFFFPWWMTPLWRALTSNCRLNSKSKFRVHVSLLFKASLSAKSFLWKLVFIHMESRTNYHHKNFALKLALKRRQTWTRKWPIQLAQQQTRI